MLQRLQVIFLEAGIPHCNQTAYQKAISCTDDIFSTQEVIAKYMRGGSWDLSSRPAKSHSLGVRLMHFDAVSLMNLLFYMGFHSFCPVRSDIAHMETELKSHSFQNWTLGSYAFDNGEYSVILERLLEVGINGKLCQRLLINNVYEGVSGTSGLMVNSLRSLWLREEWGRAQSSHHLCSCWGWIHCWGN